MGGTAPIDEYVQQGFQLRTSIIDIHRSCSEALESSLTRLTANTSQTAVSAECIIQRVEAALRH